LDVKVTCNIFVKKSRSVSILPKIIGVISANVIALLALNCAIDSPIFIGNSNIAHMKNRHPTDFGKYQNHIGLILSSPDYVGLNADGSIEFVKEFHSASEHVKVAVRVSKTGTLFVRSLYVLNPKRVKNFIKKGTLKKI